MAFDKNDPEVLAFVEEITSALTSKNRELLGELRTARAKAKGNDIDPEDYARLQSENEDLGSRLSKSEKTSKGEIDKLMKSVVEKDGALSGLLIDSGITDALAKAGVAPHYVEPLKAMFKSQASLKNEGGQFQALIGEKGLGEAITSYLSGDAGKHYAPAQANSGGGAQGAGSAKPAVSGNRSAMTVTQKAEFVAANGQDAYFKLPA